MLGNQMNVLLICKELGRCKNCNNKNYMSHESEDVMPAYLLKSLSCVQLLRPHGLYPARLLCPWDSPGKDTGVGCHFLLQGLFSTQGSNPCLLCLLHWWVGSLPPNHLGEIPAVISTKLPWMA